VNEFAQLLRQTIRTIPDFPTPGIEFRDLTPVLQNPSLQAGCVAAMTERFPSAGFDAVGGIEARGFIWGALLAHETKKPFFPFRKAGKLPGLTYRMAYDLEYGEAVMEIHRDAFAPSARILIVDDLLATGGTAAAASYLVREAGGEVAGIAFLVELGGLGGREALIRAGVPPERILSMVRYE
jgi:adenine phosphoribosyltransferase